jgi:O-antigen/teichoic acid export membrane protein
MRRRHERPAIHVAGHAAVGYPSRPMSEPAAPQHPSHHEAARVRRLLRNATWLFSGNVFAALCGFGQAVVLGRALGVDTYGLLAVIMAFVTTVNQVVDIRMWESVTKFVGDFHERGDHGRARATVKLAYLIDVATGIAAFLLVLALAPFAVHRFLHGQVAAEDVILYAGTLLVATVNDTSMALLRVFDRFGWLSAERVASAVVRLLALWAAAAATGRLTPVLAVYVAVELGRGVALLALGLHATRSALTGPGPDHIGMVRGRLGAFWRFTLNNAATTVLALITRQVDILILTALRPPGEVGLFRMAKNFGQLILRLSDPVYHAIYPELVRLVNTKPEEIGSFLRRSMRVVLLLVLPAGTVLMLAAQPVLELAVGRDFAAAATPLRIIVLGALLHAGFLWARPLALARGRAHLSTIAHGAGAAVLVAASYLLVPRFGATGSALTFVASSAVTIGVLAAGAVRDRAPTPRATTVDGRALARSR